MFSALSTTPTGEAKRLLLVVNRPWPDLYKLLHAHLVSEGQLEHLHRVVVVPELFNTLTQCRRLDFRHRSQTIPAPKNGRRVIKFVHPLVLY